MEKNSLDECCNYEALLRDHMGIFQMSYKLPVRDTKSLALVYTPGVAASCLKIEKDLNDAYRYTNKMNSMLVISDSSGFPNVINKKEWNNMAAIPYVEAISVFYKNIANIDAYPLVLDFKKISSEEDLLETLNVIMAAYSAVEFFSMCPDRLKGFYELLNRHRVSLGSKIQASDQYAFVDSSRKRELDEKLKSKNIPLSANAIYAAVLRAALDTQTYINLNAEIEQIINILADNKLKLNQQSNNYHSYFTDVLRLASEDFLSTKKTNNNIEYNLYQQELSTEYVLHKYKKYITIGESSWVESIPHKYLSHTKSNDENSLLLHARYKGIVQTGSKILMRNIYELDNLFSWKNLDHISDILIKNPEEANVLTCKSNLGAIITNGTAILGLGNIGALSGLPVMEGKSVLFKLFGGTDIIPFCFNEKDAKKFVTIGERISPIFSIINLEDIKAPDCFEIEENFQKLVEYPIFHDDQHGTAVVVLAGLINALKLRKSKPSEVKIVMNGAGAAGLSVTQLLLNYGVKNLIVCDTEGAIYKGREKHMNESKNKLAELTNPDNETGHLSEVIRNAHVFIGLSAGKVLTTDMVKSMKHQSIIFALANPVPEIYPDEAISAGAFIVATGRSDFPNQINNSLAFPGIFRAAIDARAKKITIEMKTAAAEAIAKLIPDDKIRSDFIIPGALDTEVAIAVTRAVAEITLKKGNHNESIFNADMIEENIHSWFTEGNLKNFEFVKQKNYQWKYSK